jgi:hypothetical protein
MAYQPKIRITDDSVTASLAKVSTDVRREDAKGKHAQTRKKRGMEPAGLFHIKTS